MKPLALVAKDCQGKYWQPPTNISHLQKKALIPLHAGEMARAAASAPLAFIRDGAQWQLVAVCGHHAGFNLFIKDGAWLGTYQPAWLSSYPFQTMAVADKQLVVFDQESGLLSETAGEPFFDEAGQLSFAVAERVEAVKASASLHNTTQRAITALHQAKVLLPWSEKILKATGIEIESLYMVDEKALSQLPDEAFLKLRAAQALPVAYAVNFSIQQAHLLHRLARLHGHSAISLPESEDGDLDLEFLSDSGTIRFNS